ncbi:prepilin-type N-terminal cleavage/methylation domain-containing protein, partial [bacterium]|nr:prepilin-type N-terminal cleavage/methylation domain-containing protein [bacterium]
KSTLNAKDTLCISALLHRRQIFDWKHHALVLISYVKNLRNRRSLLVPLRGFTLAEVLITLGIIGVVAALTIPTLMQKTDEKDIVAKVNKVYNTLSNAFSMAEANNGSINKWDLHFTWGNGDDAVEDANKLAEYLKPYLNISKDCGVNGTGCIYDGMYTFLDGRDRENFQNSARYKILLTDGSAITMRTTGDAEIPLNLIVDINGPKGPNQMGLDTFLFYANKNGKVVPDNRTISAVGCKKSATDIEYNGETCSAYILLNGNMNYLRE